MDNQAPEELEGIAIIGLSGRFPGGSTVNEFWHNIKQKHVSVTDLTDEQLKQAAIPQSVYSKDNYIKKAYVLDHFDKFDAAFFDMTPREAETTDPQHRILLETSHEVLEDAGYNPGTYEGRIGSFLGVGKPIYTMRNILAQPGIIESIGALEFSIRTDKSFCASKVAYKLGLTGPSVTIDTACSTSLVAIHYGCQSLLSYESDIAIAGGVALSLPMTEGYAYHDGGILAKNGHCSPFDQDSSGTTNGSGAAIVALKRLQEAVDDGDNIIAIIKGSAINNDGNRKIGYTAPSYDGQVEVITDALAVAGFEPDTVEYIEAHGTGTNMGDPLEVQALCEAYQMDENSHAELTLGAVKSNIGHLDIAAGAAGLIKTAKALQQQVLPPTANFTSLNNKIDSKHGRVRVLSDLQPWPAKDHPRRAGVSSFGIGGTNAHAVMEEPPVRETGDNKAFSLLLASARSNRLADRAMSRLSAHLHGSDINLADAAYTAQTGRHHYDFRRAAVASCNDSAALEQVIAVKNYDSSTPYEHCVFMFPGQGAQYAGMAKQLYQQEPLFAQTLDNCCELLKPHMGLDIRDIIWSTDDSQVGQTKYTQPSLFVIEYSMATLLQAWGIEPDVMIGHSIGEYVAATLAGVMSLEDALFVVSRRAAIMNQVGKGKMMIVPMAADDVRNIIAEMDLKWTSVAVENAPSLCVVAGTEAEVDQVNGKLSGRVDCHILHTSHAFHSPMMEPILTDFYQVMARVVLNPPQKPFVSNLTGQLITDQQATDPQYWVNHLRNTVKFSGGIGLLAESANSLFIEVGPGSVLTTLIQQQALDNSFFVATAGKHPKDTQHDLAVLYTCVGEAWGCGVDVDWTAFNQDNERKRVPLPTYPFERKRFWLNGPNESLPEWVEEVDEEDVLNEQAIIEPKDWIEKDILTVWVELLGIERISTDACFFSLGGHSLLASRIVVRLSEAMSVSLGIADLFESPTIAGLAKQISDLTIDATDDDELEALLSELEGVSEEELGNL